MASERSRPCLYTPGYHAAAERVREEARRQGCTQMSDWRPPRIVNPRGTERQGYAGAMYKAMEAAQEIGAPRMAEWARQRHAVALVQVDMEAGRLTQEEATLRIMELHGLRAERVA